MSACTWRFAGLLKMQAATWKRWSWTAVICSIFSCTVVCCLSAQCGIQCNTAERSHQSGPWHTAVVSQVDGTVGDRVQLSEPSLLSPLSPGSMLVGRWSQEVNPTFPECDVGILSSCSSNIHTSCRLLHGNYFHTVLISV